MENVDINQIEITVADKVSSDLAITIALIAGVVVVGTVRHSLNHTYGE